MMTISAPFTILQASGINGLSMVNSAPVTALSHGNITAIISAIFKLVRSKVRTKNSLLKLVSSQVSTENMLLNSVSKQQVSSKVSTEKAILECFSIALDPSEVVKATAKTIQNTVLALTDLVFEANQIALNEGGIK